MDEKSLVLIIILLDALGYSGEASGIATFFQNLAKISGLLGTTGDAAGSGSVFARLAQIAGYTDQIEGYVDTLETKVGANTDSAGTTTLFARLAQLAGYSDTLETNLGVTEDSASSTGSLLARLAWLVSQEGKTSYYGNASTTQLTYQTAVNTTGRGTLKDIVICPSTGTTTVRITIDGGTPITFEGSSLNSRMSLDPASGITAKSPANYPKIELLFNTSLLIEYCTTNASYAGKIGWLYEK